MPGADKETDGISNFYTNWKLSWMSERSGMITMVTPSSVTADSWKVNDFPEPVGIRASTFLPLLVALIISR